MSRLRTTFSRLLAIGGLAVTGTTIAYYRHNCIEGLPPFTAECKPAHLHLYERQEIHPATEKKPWDDNWDFRGTVPETSSKTKEEVPSVNVTGNESPSERNEVVNKPTATRHVILVRHGQYIDNDDDKFRVLSELGRQQATLTGERLKSLDIKFDKMIVSTMTRAQETANLIGESLQDVEKTHCSLLREGAPYPVEPKSTVWMPRDRTFYRDNPRIEGAFRKYIHRADPDQKEDSYELVVCHGNVIRYFVCRALQFPPEGWLRMSVGHCGLTWIAIRPNGRVSLRGLGDTGHLSKEFITFSNS